MIIKSILVLSLATWSDAFYAFTYTLHFTLQSKYTLRRPQNAINKNENTLRFFAETLRFDSHVFRKHRLRLSLAQICVRVCEFPMKIRRTHNQMVVGGFFGDGLICRAMEIKANQIRKKCS